MRSYLEFGQITTKSSVGDEQLLCQYWFELMRQDDDDEILYIQFIIDQNYGHWMCHWNWESWDFIHVCFLYQQVKFNLV